MRRFVFVAFAVFASVGLSACDSATEPADKPAVDAKPAEAPAKAEETPTKADEKAPAAKAEAEAPADPTPAAPAQPVDDPAAETAKTCAHVVEVLAKQDAVDEPTRAKVKADCEASLAEIANRHKRLTACILATGNVEEIEACEKPAQRYDSLLRSVMPSFDDVCKHVMDVMKNEMGDAAIQPSAEDMAKALDECRRSMDKEAEKIGQAEFGRRAKCVMAAEKMEDMMKCDKD